MSLVLNDVLGTRVKITTPSISISKLDTGAAPGRRRRVRDTELVQALKRIARPGTMGKRLGNIEEDRKNELEVDVNRTEASEAAFRARTTDDRNEQLALLLTAAKLYERSLESVSRLNESAEVKEGITQDLSYALEGVKRDLVKLERYILKDDIDAMRIKIEDLKMTFVSPETRTKLEKLAREHQIDSMTYRILEGACMVGAAAVTAIGIMFVPVQGILLPISGGMVAIGGRMRWKAKSERMKMKTVMQLIEDRADSADIVLEKDAVTPYSQKSLVATLTPQKTASGHD